MSPVILTRRSFWQRVRRFPGLLLRTYRALRRPPQGQGRMVCFHAAWAVSAVLLRRDATLRQMGMRGRRNAPR